ncbi:HAMP domain-containing histidine kinase [Sulfurimonas sp. MAG313]|nr:HAMP domain-containing sensor histidine kinase [Sulfurimonas sp. MAG313]MDF1880184.1 HAMP domain-containing histidine kinase [Sulfurimonas sp. MAG313]
MNSLEKKSFYSFIALYTFSSSLFILLSAFWYYTAQKNSFQSNEYYKLQHIADAVSKEIISSHMQGKGFHIPKKHDGVRISLVDVNNTVVYGQLETKHFPLKEDFLIEEKHSLLISTGTSDHLNIRFVLVYSQGLYLKTETLRKNVFGVIIMSIIIMVILAWLLSRIFMRPLHQKIKQIEDFVHDTAHELNTPITALSMSVSRAMKKQVYDEKILKNISISTKQLFDIYNALSYLSFESQKEPEKDIDLKDVLIKSVQYYQELSESKKIVLNLQAESYSFKIDETKITMLFGNLINNAIKYSHPSSHIDIFLKDGVFKIQDYGIGIEKEKLGMIYEIYNRETEYAGGFGVGLSIVQKITQEYKIDIKVESEPTKGSTFTLSF